LIPMGKPEIQSFLAGFHSIPSTNEH
jgi:hypothetical protein